MRNTAEKAVVAKDARVVEEVVVGKEASHRIDTISDSVRRTDVDVEADSGEELAESSRRRRSRSSR